MIQAGKANHGCRDKQKANMSIYKVHLGCCHPPQFLATAYGGVKFRSILRYFLKQNQNGSSAKFCGG